MSKRTKGVLALTLLLLQSLPAVATKRYDSGLCVAPAPLPPQAVTQVAYSSYLGGNHADEARALATDAAGNFYVAGSTNSSNFPVAHAAHAEFHGPVSIEDAFVAKFSAAGTLLYSTYLGGRRGDQANDVAVDADGYAYLTGVTDSTNFPTRNAVQGAKAGDCSDAFSNCLDAFVARLDPTGSQLIFSTYLGGGSRSTTVNDAGDAGVSISADAAGNAYVTGTTASSDFPTVRASQPLRGGNGDAFLTKVSAAGAIVFSTYVGGVGDESAHAVAGDSAGGAYLVGIATSPGFPTTPGAFQLSFAGSYESLALARDGFVVRLTDDTPNQPQLRIIGARVSGKKLFVSGENFALGALLFVNGEKQKKSANDDLSPTTLLVARKSGKWIPAGQAVTLEVKNPDGTTSPPFLYRRPD